MKVLILMKIIYILYNIYVSDYIFLKSLETIQ